MKFRTLAAAGLGAVTSLMPYSASAFSPGDDGTHSIELSDNCYGLAYVNTDVGSEHAYARVGTLSPVEAQFAGGGLYAYSTSPTSVTPIDKGFLASCIGVAESDISGLSQTGPTDSFAEDTYIGFSFTLLTPTSTLVAGPYSVSTDGVTVPDTTPPSVQLSTTVANPTNSNPIAVSVTFSEDVTGFGLSDIVVGNGTAASLSGSGRNYSFNVTPSGDGTVTVDIAAGAAEDAAGNDSTAATQLSRVYDATAPGVSLDTTASDPTNGAFQVTATFTESVTGFTLADIDVGNGSASTLQGSGANYSFTVTPSSDGTVTVDVAGSRASDAAGNSNTAATQLSLTYDGTKPEVELTSTVSDPTNTSPIGMSVAFSEEVTGFTLSDVVVNNGVASNFAGSGDSYSFDVTPSGQGAVSVDVPAGVAQDEAGNTNTAAAQFGATYDSVAPTLQLSTVESDPTNQTPIKVTATFSEDVTGFVLGDVVVGNGSASNFAGSGSSYSFDVTPADDGAVTVDVAAAAAKDAAGNDSTAATQLSLTYDGTAPTVSLAGPEKIGVDPFTVVATFSEDVSGLEISEIEIVGGSITDLDVQSPGSSVYHLTVEPVIGEDITITIPQDAAFDAATNGNERSNSYQVDGLTVADVLSEREEEVRNVVRRLTLGQMRQRVKRHSGMMDRAVERRGTGAAELGGTFNFAADGLGFASDGSINGVGVLGNGTRAVLEGEMTFASTDGDDDVDSSYFYLRGALEKDLTAATLAGVFVEGEFSSSEFSGDFTGTEDGKSLIAGAYVVHAFSEALFGQAYASYGVGNHGLDMADDILSLEGDYRSESFELGAALNGAVDLGWGTFAPGLSMFYGETEIGDLGLSGEAYGLTQDGLSVSVPKVTLARVSFAPALDLPLPAQNGATAMLSIAPSLICEQYDADRKVEGCGYGLDLTARASKDGTLQMSLSGESLNGTETYSASFSVNYAF